MALRRGAGRRRPTVYGVWQPPWEEPRFPGPPPEPEPTPPPYVPAEPTPPPPYGPPEPEYDVYLPTRRRRYRRPEPPPPPPLARYLPMRYRPWSPARDLYDVGGPEVTPGLFDAPLPPEAGGYGRPGVTIEIGGAGPQYDPYLPVDRLRQYAPPAESPWRPTQPARPTPEHLARYQAAESLARQRVAGQVRPRWAPPQEWVENMERLQRNLVPYSWEGVPPEGLVAEELGGGGWGGGWGGGGGGGGGGEVPEEPGSQIDLGEGRPIPAGGLGRVTELRFYPQDYRSVPDFVRPYLSQVLEKLGWRPRLWGRWGAYYFIRDQPLPIWVTADTLQWISDPIIREWLLAFFGAKGWGKETVWPAQPGAVEGAETGVPRA